jgi:hypothetical protein
MKKCSQCFELKQITDYYVLNKAKDGRQAMCIPCYKSYFKNWTEIRQGRPQSEFPQSKTCTTCHVEKPISQFGTRSSSLDKKLSVCKPCWRIAVTKARRRHMAKKALND